MKQYRFYLLTVLACLTLAGCTKDMVLPVASGRPYEVLVVLEDEVWDAPAGRALFNILDTDVPCLPQSERSFRISHTDPKHYDHLMQLFRNIILVNIDKTQFSQARMRFARDKYATEQIILTINAPSLESLQELCEQHRQEVVDFLTRKR